MIKMLMIDISEFVTRGVTNSMMGAENIGNRLLFHESHLSSLSHAPSEANQAGDELGSISSLALSFSN
jgi:hypothetical protein